MAIAWREVLQIDWRASSTLVFLRHFLSLYRTLALGELNLDRRDRCGRQLEMHCAIPHGAFELCRFHCVRMLKGDGTLNSSALVRVGPQSQLVTLSLLSSSLYHDFMMTTLLPPPVSLFVATTAVSTVQAARKLTYECSIRGREEHECILASTSIHQNAKINTHTQQVCTATALASVWLCLVK